jgi:xylose dehydrogenase (NAD/NADP)
VRFAVLAPTSTVARLAVIPAMLSSPESELVAVASLSAEPGAVPGVPSDVRWERRYEAVLEDDRVEAVYIPLPNSLHRQWVEAAAEAGKHVLCEKPIAVTAADARAMAASCEEAGVVLMEAYMTPFHPRARAIAKFSRSGALGEFLFGFAAFTGRLSRPDDHRWHPEMGGGALLDVGIYCLSPLLQAAGAAADQADGRGVLEVTGTSRPGEGGADASFSGFLAFGGGSSASFQCSFEAPERQYLELVGTEAAVLVERAFTPSHGDRVVFVRKADGSYDELETDGGDPYLSMLEHFCDVVRGRAELERPPRDSIALAALVDRLKASANAEDRHDG